MVSCESEIVQIQESLLTSYQFIDRRIFSRILHISFVGREDLYGKLSPDNLFFVSDLSEIVDFLVGPETVLTTTFDDFSAFHLFVFVTTAFVLLLPLMLQCFHVDVFFQ